MKRPGLKSSVAVIGILWISLAAASAQPVPSGPPAPNPSVQAPRQPTPGMMKLGKMPMMRHDMHRMMPEMMGREMGETRSPAAPRFESRKAGRDFGPFTAPFHRWIACLMAQRGLLGLSSGQISELDDLISEHLQSAIRGQAEIRALQVELRRILRQDSVDMQSVEALLGKISKQELELQIEGFRMYRSVLDLLTTEQRQKARDLIGTPFPAPWEEMQRAASRGIPEEMEMESEEEEPEEDEGEGHQH